MQNENTQNEIKLVWQRPVITCVDIKKTLAASGNLFDGGLSKS